MLVGDGGAFGWAEEAEEEVDGGEATDTIFVTNSCNFLVEAVGIAVGDGVEEAVISLAELLAAGLVHGEGVAEGGADVGEVDRGDGEDAFTGGGLVEGVESGVEALVVTGMGARSDVLVEGATKDRNHGAGWKAGLVADVVEPNGG